MSMIPSDYPVSQYHEILRLLKTLLIKRITFIFAHNFLLFIYIIFFSRSSRPSSRRDLANKMNKMNKKVIDA